MNEVYFQQQFSQIQGSLDEFFATTQEQLAAQEDQDKTKNAAYFYEQVKLQITSLFRNAAIFGEQVADYAQFLDPSMVNFGPTIGVAEPAGEKFTWNNTSKAAAKVINSDAYQILLSNMSGGNRDIWIGNRITGNGFLVQGDQIHSVVKGQITATRSLSELFHITPGSNTGTIHLENGSKLTFVFDFNDEGKAFLKQMHITHVDGSYAIVKDVTNPSQLEVVSSEQDDNYMPFVEALVPDGESLFMGSEGASLFQYNSNTKEFTGEFGDSRALEFSLSTASFGGNLYNFFLSPDDKDFYPQQLIKKYMEDDLPMSNLPPGLGVPPEHYDQPVDRYQGPINFSGTSIDDLIMEDLSGYDPSMEKAKQQYLRQQLGNGRLDMETKMFILLYLFIQDNNEETEEVFQKLAGWDPTANPSENGASPDVVWTEDNIDQASIKEQMDFWSNHKADYSGSDPDMQRREDEQHATMVNGKMSGLTMESTLLQARLTNIIRDRQRFTDTITNAMKALDDALSNAVRRIV
jgi:hypothetical protein